MAKESKNSAKVEVPLVDVPVGKLTSEDSARARDRNRVRAARHNGHGGMVIWLLLGPGVLAMLGENDGPSILSYAATGATYGIGFFLPVIAVTFAAAYVVREMAMRLGAVTHRGYGELIFQRFGPIWGWLTVVDLVITNLITLVTEIIAIRVGMGFFGISTPLAVLSAVAFLEAIVNEVWQDAADSGPGQHRFHGDRIPENALATMRELWNGKENAERAMSTLSKFQIALVCAGHDRMDRGTEPYQSVDVLIDLRNALGHFKPQWWHDDGTGTANYIAALRDKLKGRENRQPIGNPWYPNKVLGAGCADWACDSAIAFARDWYGRMGLTEFDGRYVMPSEPVEVDD